MQNIAGSYINKILDPQAAKNPTSSSKNEIDKFLDALKSQEFKAELVKYLKEHQRLALISPIDTIMDLVTKSVYEYLQSGSTSMTTALALKVLFPTGNLSTFLQDVEAVAQNFPATKESQEDLEKFHAFIQQFPLSQEKVQTHRSPWEVGVTVGA